MSEALSTELPQACWAVRRMRLRLSDAALSRFTGAYTSRFHGRGMEFSEFGPYVAGDDARRIDWLLTARRRRPYVRRYHEERDLHVVLAVDVSPSMRCIDGREAPLARAVQAAAFFALAAAHTGDRLSAALFGSPSPVLVGPGRGTRHALQVLARALAEHQPGPRSDARPLFKLLGNLRRGALVVLISDFAFDPDVAEPTVRQPLQGCARRHTLLGVCLSHCALPQRCLAMGRQSESGALLTLRSPSKESRLQSGQYGLDARLRAALLHSGMRAVVLRPGDDIPSGLASLMGVRHSYTTG